MTLKETAIPGCFLIDTFQHEDHRGGFVKVFNYNTFENTKTSFKPTEVYYTWSVPNVFRGFHFQLPPNDHAKIVFCNYGGVVDYIVDLRKNSSVYGMLFSFSLSAENRRAILIPRGCAHGFYVPSIHSMLTYLVETEYNPESDFGIHWLSFEHSFEFTNPIISERDSKFTMLDNFDSPFIMP
jgi:dTDP-4-dehydrorhamnose 3,5-epimerase